MTIRIDLTQNKQAIVDEIDEDIANYHWRAHIDSHTKGTMNEVWYATRYEIMPNKTRIYINMHTIILEKVIGRKPNTGELVDHIDHDGLNNRRSNLRLSTSTLNQANQRPQARPKSSVYKGVHWDKEYNNWRARIFVHGVRIHLGRFRTEKEAASAYNEAAAQYYGPFACLNQI
jgi:hypothetical protein